MSEQNDPTGTLAPATRVARVIASTTYPIVSAWEFEFLKVEEIIQERWDKSTLYLVVQRPLTYFDNVTFGEYYINFQIADGVSPPLSCRINLVANERSRPSRWCNFGCGRGPSSGGFGGDV
ncbi:ATP-dependent HslUV protease ATP-binding subunit HslU [Sphingopyxis macrogoltabida]|uniref:ATP-dependent HslUV protease ATP-binding subunit HslU n=1 Tax=Sphingopyxis macrogoltabida TaxID=33050 RepID=A0AAC8YZ87_SPHMC|nr:ATP-dependent HslUV protease ATP-binding subunit HslU [Sphingopyxis macrogoltabida]AMU88960.1 ATP-dependent HslUV protease ATP-binding subunit HslU [Sphingopyxis macrogoltabida]